MTPLSSVLLALVVGFPTRPVGALPARVLCAEVSLSHDARQEAWAEAVLQGNVPEASRHYVELDFEAADARGELHHVLLRVLPDYLAIGSETDAVRVPLDRPRAHRVARAMNAWLPTPAVVDRIYERAAVRLDPEPLPPHDRMSGPGYLLWHRRTVDEPLQEVLIAGHKKDVVLTRELVGRPDKLAIYGWHRAEGFVIQPVSLYHGARYADYSHGIRLISRTMTLDGVDRDALEVLADPVLWSLLSDEGPFPEAAAVLAE